MYEISQYTFFFDEQYPEASSTDSLSNEIEEAVRLGIIKGYNDLNSNLHSSTDSDIKYYTVATQPSLESQQYNILYRNL